MKGNKKQKGCENNLLNFLKHKYTPLENLEKISLLFDKNLYYSRVNVSKYWWFSSNLNLNFIANIGRCKQRPTHHTIIRFTGDMVNHQQ